MGKKLDFEQLAQKAVQNIEDDRAETKVLLKDMIAWVTGATTNKQIPGQSDRHKDVGIILAKYVETLQRSNEQLVKIAAILKKKDDENNELDEDERLQIFDQLNTEIQKSPDKTKKGK